MSDIVERLRVRRNPMLDGEREEAADDIEWSFLANHDEIDSLTLACKEIARLRGLVGIESADLDLDWNRLRSGDRRALIADHQDVFDMVTAKENEIERLRDIIYRASKEWQSLNKEADDEIKRLRDYIAKMERGYKHFRDTAEAEYARLHTEIEQLRMVTAPGSCECSPEEACRYARERDDARAEIERLRADLAAMSDSVQVAAKALNEEEREIERLRGLLRPFAVLPVDALGQCQRHPDEPVFAINGVSFTATDVLRAREALGD